MEALPLLKKKPPPTLKCLKNRQTNLVTNFGTHGMVLSPGMFMCIMKVLTYSRSLVIGKVYVFVDTDGHEVVLAS